MKKRIISALAALMLIFSIFSVFATTASADGTYGQLKLMNVGRVTAGSTFTLTIKFSNIDKDLADLGIATIQFNLEYDHALIETSDKSFKCSAIDGWEINGNVDATQGICTFFVADIEGKKPYNTTDDLVMTLDFTASSDAAGKDVIIEVKDIVIGDVDFETDYTILGDTVDFTVSKKSSVSANIGGNTYFVDTDDKSASLSAVTDKSVTNLAIPSSVTYNGTTLKVVSVESGAFADLKSLKSVYIPCTVKSVNAGMFDESASVTIRGCRDSAAYNFAMSEGFEWESVTSNYKETVIKESTCLEHGYSQLACPDCGAVSGSQKELPLGAHKYGDWVVIKEATDEESGSRERTCSVCGTKDTEVIPKTNCPHENKKDVIVKEPTCTAVGSKNIVCADCGKVLEENIEVAKAAHSFGEWVVIKEATVKDKGSREHTCTVCGTKETEEIPSLACKHTNTTNGHRDATCTKDGYDSTTCKDCGTLLSYTKIPAKHTEGPTESKEATCTEDGYVIQKCTVCGEVLKNEIKPATGHEYGDWVVLAPATVDNVGVRTHTCSKCGNSENEVIPKLDPPADVSKDESVPELESSAPAVDSSATASENEPSGSGNNTVFFIIGAVVILLTVGYIVIMAINKKKNY